MGDFAIFLQSLNLGPANTILLLAIFYFLQKAFIRIEQHERRHIAVERSVAFIKGTLNMKEES